MAKDKAPKSGKYVFTKGTVFKGEPHALGQTVTVNPKSDKDARYLVGRGRLAPEGSDEAKQPLAEARAAKAAAEKPKKKADPEPAKK